MKHLDLPESQQIRQQVSLILDRLMAVYGMPTWRDPLPPVDELVSTILSQNTNDRNRDVAFYALKGKFSNWNAVRLAPVEEIIDAVRPAGLAPQKGPRIKEVLNQIHSERGNLDLSFLSDLPLEEARQWLLKFKGVGRKTAAIVLQFSLNRPAFPVDTHIFRVSGRLGLRPQKISLEDTHNLMEALINPQDYYSAHLNLIRLGRETCHAKKADCLHCPLNDLCPSKN